MQIKAILSAILFALCIGCTSEQWVREYVGGETSGLQEALNKHMAEAGNKQEELIKKQTALGGQITEMQVSLQAMDKKLTEWQDSLGRLTEVEKPVEEILDLRSEIEDRFAKLEEMEKDLNRLKESERADTIVSDKELSTLADQINDAKRFVDMNVTEVLKAQNHLKDYIIEEVRLLKVEQQEYAKELETIKSRLQTLESAVGRKKLPEI